MTSEAKEPSVEYILQGEDSLSCGLIAVLNAMRYYGMETPGPDDPEWPGMLWAVKCTDGPCLKDCTDMFDFFSLIQTERGGDTWPRIVTVEDPEIGGCHAIFEPEQGVVVNYRRTKGPVVEHVIVTPRTLGSIGGPPWWSLAAPSPDDPEERDDAIVCPCDLKDAAMCDTCQKCRKPLSKGRAWAYWRCTCKTPLEEKL